jgi:hypothetical protein
MAMHPRKIPGRALKWWSLPVVEAPEVNLRHSGQSYHHETQPGVAWCVMVMVMGLTTGNNFKVPRKNKVTTEEPPFVVG